jgi:hypothetical protein
MRPHLRRGLASNQSHWPHREALLVNAGPVLNAKCREASNKQIAKLLEARGWRVRRALDFSADPEAYRQYIADSRGEWTVANDQNVRLRSEWFSDRAATYLRGAQS